MRCASLFCQEVYHADTDWFQSQKTGQQHVVTIHSWLQVHLIDSIVCWAEAVTWSRMGLVLPTSAAVLWEARFYGWAQFCRQCGSVHRVAGLWTVLLQNFF